MPRSAGDGAHRAMLGTLETRPGCADLLHSLECWHLLPGLLALDP